jgi:hypothetical protein
MEDSRHIKISQINIVHLNDTQYFICEATLSSSGRTTHKVWLTIKQYTSILALILNIFWRRNMQTARQILPNTGKQCVQNKTQLPEIGHI